MNIFFGILNDALLEVFFNKIKVSFYLQVNELCYRLGSVSRRVEKNYIFNKKNKAIFQKNLLISLNSISAPPPLLSLCSRLGTLKPVIAGSGVEIHNLHWHEGSAI